MPIKYLALTVALSVSFLLPFAVFYRLFGTDGALVFSGVFVVVALWKLIKRVFG